MDFISTNSTAFVPTLTEEHYTVVLTPRPTRSFIPTSWYHPSHDVSVIVTPSMVATKQDLCDTDPIFAAVNETMAFEEDFWDI